MRRDDLREPLALGVLVLAALVATLGIPRDSWRTSFADPCHLAAACGVVVVAALVVTRRLGERGARVERGMLAVFLTGMPLVYVASWLWAPPEANARWLWIELLAVAPYGALAIAGARRSPRYLAIGIAAHGIFWDAWHLALHAPSVPRWYASGCLLLDVALALYVAARAMRWSEAARGMETAP